MIHQQIRRDVRRARILSLALTPVVPALLLAASSSAYGQETITYNFDQNYSFPLNISSADNPLTLNYTLGGVAIQSGAISESTGVAGQVHKAGSGSFLLEGAETYTGGTFVDQGNLQLGSAGANSSLIAGFTGAGTTAVVIASGAGFQVSAGSSVTGGSTSASVTGTGDSTGGAGGIGVSSSGALNNYGSITGGAGQVDESAGFSSTTGGAGGSGVVVNAGASQFNNYGSIAGGSGGDAYGNGGSGGTSVWIKATGNFSNAGNINGGGGAAGQYDGDGGTGLLLDAAATFNNSGNITAGNAGVGIVSGFAPSGGSGGNAVVINNGTFSQTGGTITGGNSSNNPTGAQAGNGVVVNGGTLACSGGWIYGGSGGTSSLGGSAVVFNVPATFTNVINLKGGSGDGGTGAGFGGAPGGGYGILFNAAATFSNVGNIFGGDGDSESAGGTGARLAAGGGMVNYGVIYGGAGGTDLFGHALPAGNGLEVDGVGTVTNAGIISGGTGVVFSGGVGTLINNSAGSIQGGVSMDNYANQVTLLPGSVINGSLNMGTSSAATLTLDGTGSQTYSGAVTGGTTLHGTLIKKGAGEWLLDTNLATAAVQITGGTLHVVNGGGISGNVTDNTSLIFDRSDSFTFNGSVSGSGSMTKQNTGTLTLNGSVNNLAGGFSVTAGGLNVASGSSIQGANGAAGIFTGFTFTPGGNGSVGLTISSTGTIKNSGTIYGGNGGFGVFQSGNGAAAVQITSTGTFDNSGNVVGGSSLGAFAGPGILASGGAVIINESTGSIQPGTPPGSPFGVGILATSGATTLTNKGVISGGVYLADQANAVTLFTGSSIQGDLVIGSNTGASLTLDGSGTQAYSAAVTGGSQFNGALTKKGSGEWQVDKSFNTTAVTITSGTLHVIAGGSITGNITNNASLIFDRGDSSTYTGSITGSGLVTLASGVLTIGNGSITTSHANAGLTVTGTAAFNNKGSIHGGKGDDAVFGANPVPVQPGGTGVVISSTGTSTNSGSITGGDGGSGGSNVHGGTGVQINSVATLDNSGSIVGGTTPRGDGGTGIVASGGATIINEATGSIAGGNPGGFFTAHGSGISISSGVGTLINKGTINDGVSMPNAANQVTLYTGSKMTGGLNMSSNTAAALTLSGDGIQTFSGAVSGGFTFGGSLIKEGLGTWKLDQSLNYSGSTSINSGTLALIGSGAIPNSSSIIVAPGATFDVSGLTTVFHLGQSQSLVGSITGNINLAGTINGSTTITGNVSLTSTGHIAGYSTVTGTVSGSGSVDPGNSPGLVTAGQIDPSGGIAFNFELTQQGAPDFADPSNIGNDVLRLTEAPPFTSALTSANTINLYLSAAAFNGGSTDIQGGIFSDSETPANLVTDVENSLVHVFVADPSGGTIYNGQSYSSLDLSKYNFGFAAIPESAQFGGNSVSGAITDLQITPAPVPEPSAGVLSLLLGTMASYYRPRRRKNAPRV